MGAVWTAQAEDLTTGQCVVGVEKEDPRLLFQMFFRWPGDGTLQAETVYAVLVDLELAKAMRGDREMRLALMDHLDTRAGLAAEGRWNSTRVNGGVQRLMAFLGDPGPAANYQDAWDTTEKLLSQRFPGWGAPGSFAVELALGESDSAAVEASQPGASGLLSKREEEVARLVADGLSNKQIGARLYISERTVEGHVRRILNKLGFNSRAQIAGWMASPNR